MKRYIFIFMTILSACMTSCYDNYVYEGISVEGIKTLPPEYMDSHVILKGETSDVSERYWYYEVSRSKDFSDEVISMQGAHPEIYYFRLNGTYYYRLYLASGSDKVYSDYEESFSVDNRLTISQPYDLTSDKATISCSANVAFEKIKFIVSKDKEFQEYETYTISKSTKEDDNYRYEDRLTNLTPGTTYYVKAVADVMLGSIESDVVALTTENASVQSVTIYGDGINGDPIIDDLLVVVLNTNTNTWSDPYNASYNNSEHGYVINDFSYILEPDYIYKVYAVNQPVRWDSSGNVVFGGGDFHYGNQQRPVYYGAAEVTLKNPYLKMELTPWTCQIAVSYPVQWGPLKEVWLNDLDKVLPGDAWNLETKTMIWSDNTYRGVSDKGSVLSADESQYIFTFNIFPVNINPNTCSVTLQGETGEHTFACPELNMQSGKTYNINFEEKENLDITDVTVTEWDESDGGNFVINPKK